MSTLPEENPYASPLTPAQQILVPDDIRIEFDGEVEKSDLVYLLRRSGFLVFDVFMLSVLLLGLSLQILTLIFGGSLLSQSGLIVLNVLLIALFGWGLWKNLGYGRASQMAKNFPQCVGHLRGRFIENRFEIETSRSQSVYRLDAVVAITVNFYVVALTFDPQKFHWIVLPRRIFRDQGFGQVQSILYGAMANRRYAITSENADARYLGPDQLYPTPAMPSDGIPYTGRLVLGDLINTSLLLKACAVPVAFILVKLSILLGIAYVQQDNTFVFWLCIVAAVFLTFFSGLSVFRMIRLASQPSKPIMDMAGWLSEAGITRVSTVNGSFFSWDGLQLEYRDEEKVALRLPGKFRVVLVLKADHFSSPSVWEEAKRLIESKLGA